MRIPRTEYMMLGRTGRGVGSTNFLQNPRTSPSFPQNILRATFLNGLGCTTRMLNGLGDMATDIIDPWQGPDATAAVQDDMSTPAMPATATPPAASSSSSGFKMSANGMVLSASLSLLSGLVSAVHGWKRDHTPISVFGWGTLGMMFPIITPAVALAQGYGRRRHG